MQLAMHLYEKLIGFSWLKIKSAELRVNNNVSLLYKLTFEKRFSEVVCKKSRCAIFQKKKKTVSDAHFNVVTTLSSETVNICSLSRQEKLNFPFYLIIISATPLTYCVHRCNYTPVTLLYCPERNLEQFLMITFNSIDHMYMHCTLYSP